MKIEDAGTISGSKKQKQEEAKSEKNQSER